MQTFLPHADFEMSARELDRVRLNKQVVENYQIFKKLMIRRYLKMFEADNETTFRSLFDFNRMENARHMSDSIFGEEFFNEWKDQRGYINHPAVVMWEEYEDAFAVYSLAIAKETQRRKIKIGAFINHWILHCGFSQNLEIDDDFISENLHDAYEKYRDNVKMPEWFLDEQIMTKIVNTHRGNLYIKDDLSYRKFKEYGKLPYLYPTSTKNYGYYWPKQK